MGQKSRHRLFLRFCGYLVSNGFFRGKAEGVDLRELGSQVIVKRSELCITPVDIPLVVQDPDVHLKQTQRTCIKLLVLQ